MGIDSVVHRAVHDLDAELRRRCHPGGVDPSRLLPWVDEVGLACGTGRGGYLVTDRPLVPLRTAAEQVLIPDDAGASERAALLGDAIAYVAGPGWRDAFAAVEALACGTPVIARVGTPSAEVVEPGVTGVIVERAGDVAGAVLALANVDRWACRKAALDRYSVERRALDVLAAVERPYAVAAAA